MNPMNPIEYSGFNFGKFESTYEANNVDNEENVELNVKREKTFSKIFEYHKLTNSIPDKNYPKRLVDIYNKIAKKYNINYTFDQYFDEYFNSYQKIIYNKAPVV